MLSHIVEYECQYTDQLYKKRKIWHDGRLKYFQINNKFTLYTEKDNILLASEFKTNSKELRGILNPEGFDIEEHRVFSQFLVIISSIIEEYDRDIQVTASHVRTDVPNSSLQRQQLVISQGVPTLNHTSTAREIHPKRKVVTSKNKQKEDDGAEGGFNISKLTLKVNRPFKKPKRILDANVVNELNRPSVRRKRIPETIAQGNAANTHIKEVQTIPKEFGGKYDSESRKNMEEMIKTGIRRVGRIRRIVHEPLNI
ncbi:hypothetical protein SKDZ_07G2940 [Saccharomyces kudriavzevii ZP591]|uniref:YGR042W-like protein n=1 Tax=Saccharomyces cerevisiae x Saccharomyces kudriavzevii (strain VIN7) TaxID=1095631 RepID=H0GV08_SACCK|nr:YGR042W-like protein [Saccharomyces cerevisiae x Saccharomyces kudriavzevii VIN7]CAI4062242.1 hypothetical protein SKDZ_07G2940 [Saccharomyces kudriavzevii ZP591]CAI5272375.1 AIS_HP2_G0019360.mRNA.1.CDS.1 [Saccharomyces cerevisiae]CAI6517525.1 AIS_HP2_G0019360.mRNA.1.CDS.1 [Saccharomyces cerevisiae]